MTNSKELRKIVCLKEFPTQRYINYAAETSRQSIEAIRRKIDGVIKERRKLQKQG